MKKIAYISRPSLADADFPLIKAMQNNGIDVVYYLFISPYNKQATLFNIKKQYPKIGIFSSDIYPEFKNFKNYIDTKKIRIINSTKKSDFHPLNIILLIKVILELVKNKFEVIHLTWPPLRNKLFFYILQKKLVLTLHDPFPHSKKNSFEFELCRILAFKLIPKIILLNNKQTEAFKQKYNIPTKKIFFSRLGTYDAINCFNPSKIEYSNFILFFGSIAPYKGIEDLLIAVNSIYERNHNIKLIVAGAGKLYFSQELYENKNHIKIINRYLSMEETIALLEKALFVVCPYKDATQSGVIQTAFALNVPVLATNVGNFADVIQHNETGIIIDANNQKSLEKALEDLLNSPKQLENFRINISKKLLIDWNTIINDYTLCYNS